MTTAEVKLWDRRIGAVTWSDADRLASFEYARNFLGSGIEVSPIVMPLDAKIYQFPGLPARAFNGLPGMLADSLPDRYGSALIDEWLARQGRTPDSFHPVERLCYVGTRGMGALEYHPSHGPRATAGAIDVGGLVELANAALAKHGTLRGDVTHDPDAMNQILQVGTSAGGARPKAVIAWNPETGVVRSGQAGLAPGFSHWILKLDGVRSSDDREVGTTLGYGQIEYAYHELALRAGIHMTECRILAEGGRHHFLARRFDRTATGTKLHMQSLAALAHYDYEAAGAYSYEQAVDVMRRLRLSPDEIAQQFRRTVFNIVARNQDDHVKNIAFLMDKDGRWSLSPAFDVTYSYNPSGQWTSQHQMSVNGKRDDFASDDLLAFAAFCRIKPARARRVVADVVHAVRGWPEIAAKVGLPQAKTEAVRDHHRTSF